MKISILCSDRRHPIQPLLQDWCRRRGAEHQVELVAQASDLTGGDILFLVSCHEIIGAPIRARFSATLVVHASDLPDGRGWSPHIWSILQGATHLTVTIFQADDTLDAGPIWKKQRIDLEGHELCDEINDKLFAAELALMDFAVANAATIRPLPQAGGGGTTFPLRKPEDSRIDPNRPIADQFNLLRVADPDRYPAFFDHLGHRFEIVLRKAPK
jgi:methionyl-tRNA formyltransferase